MMRRVAAVARKMKSFLQGWLTGHLPAILSAELCSEWMDCWLEPARNWLKRWKLREMVEKDEDNTWSEVCVYEEN